MVLIDEIEDEVALHPSVHWAQRKETISIKIIVTDAKTPKIDLTDSSLTFQVQGTGAKGLNLYKFQLDFYKPIDAESCVYKVTPSYVDVQITKQGYGEWWPRLLPENVKKPHYLKLDFDRWKSESDEEQEIEKNQYAQDLLKSLEEDDNEKVDKLMRNIYLGFYNFVQFLLFSAIAMGCLAGYTIYGKPFQVGVYNSMGSLVIFAVVLAYLETFHSAFGLVKTKWLFTTIQVTGRCIAMLSLTLGGSLVQTGWAVWWLYLVWSFADVIRYLLYFLQIINQENKLLTWLRYHAWIVLYPLGGYFESVIITEAAVELEEHGTYCIRTPYPVAFSVCLSGFLRFYAVFLAIAVLVMMRHMWKMRQRKFGSRKKYKAA